jgi:hypothetical protein
MDLEREDTAQCKNKQIPGFLAVALLSPLALNGTK